MTAPDPAPPSGDDPAIAATKRWVERAVIGLNLCPFAQPVHAAGRIRYVTTSTRDTDTLIDVLSDELERLAAAGPDDFETTLLIHPQVLQDFLDYNDFLDTADALVEELDLDGIVQVASFHPHYQFEGTAPDDIGNYTNRSPHPTLHLLREDSVERAVAMHPDTESIPRRNIETLRRLGHAGWKRLGIGDGDSDSGTSTASSASRPRP